MKWDSFKQKNVFIFGGSSGIGLAAARQFARQGAGVFIFARDEMRLRNAKRKIERERPGSDGRVVSRSVDVTKPAQVEQAVKEVVQEYGAPDILINCAGRAIPGTFESIGYDRFNQTMEINLSGTWNTAYAALPYMKKKGGTIVNTASVAGFLGVFGYTDYAASKFGIIGFSESLRYELKPHNIDVCVLCPPDTRTPGYDAENETKPHETRALSQGGGLLEADQVADALLKGIAKGNRVILPGFNTKLAWYLKRWCPGLVEILMNRTIRRAQKESRPQDRSIP